jgi:hypothetical protein
MLPRSMLLRESNWPDKKVERLLAMLRAAAGDEREALTRVVLTPRGGTDEWRPYFVRIDIARPGDPPPVEPDDLGPVRVLVERTSVSEIAVRFEQFYADGAAQDLVLGGTPVPRPFGENWTHGFFGAQDARAWGVCWPFDQVRIAILDPPPFPFGALDGKVYGPAKSLHAIFPRISGLAVYHSGTDARLQTTQLYVWDYRARVVRCFVRDGHLRCQTEAASNVMPRIAAFTSPGERPLPMGDLREIAEAEVPEDTNGVDVQLTLDGETLDRHHSGPNDQVLPDGTPVPETRSIQLLKLFLPPRSAIGPLTEPYLRRRLCENIKEAITAFELRAVLHQLENDGLVEKHMLDVQPQDLGMPGLPARGEPGWDATGMGLKAATLGRCSDSAVAPWALGEVRLVDQGVLAVGRGARFLRHIDGSCPLSTTEDVEAAVRAAIDRRDIEEEKPGWYKLTDRGVARHAQLETELRERALATASPRPESTPSIVGILTTPPAAPAFIRDPNLRVVIDRDLLELSKAMAGGMYKTILLLAGSVVEAILLDVLDRNAVVAKTHLRGKQRWPDDAGLAALVGMARDTTVQLADGSTRPLLTMTSAAVANGIKDHRDLVHPYAEIRDAIEVDATTAKSMVHLLDVVSRDLQKSDEAGALDAYEQGNTV